MSNVQLLPIRQGISIAYRHDGAKDKGQGLTGLFWLGGFMSDMEGSKAKMLAKLAQDENRPCLRFDYSGHGQSQGIFRDGTVSKWLEESAAAFLQQTSGPRIIIGSSMGGWLALLLYRYLQKSAGDAAKRVKGIVLIAPAVDMTERLMWNKYDAVARNEITTKGFFLEPSEYGDEPYIITRDLIEDGSLHLIMNKRSPAFDISCPVRILQGENDQDVPWKHGYDVYDFLQGSDVIFTLIKSGDHRLSKPRDLATIKHTCQQLLQISDGGE